MTTLIKKFFPTENELLNYLRTRFPTGSPSGPLSVIVHIGYLNDLLAEPRGKKDRESIESYIKWIESKYLGAIKNKTIYRKSNDMGTTPDSIVDKILIMKFNISDERAKNISDLHRLSMMAENLIGSFLEEYLDEKLKDTKWVCCFGEVLKYSDFCHPDNLILQVKNRDNTENSSSNKIRKNNNRIKMWFRVFSKTGNSNWDKLHESLLSKKLEEKIIVDGKAIILNELDFEEFIKNRFQLNPYLLKYDGKLV